VSGYNYYSRDALVLTNKILIARKTYTQIMLYS